VPVQIAGIIVGEACMISIGGGVLGGLGAHFIYANIGVNDLSSGLIQSFDVRWNTVLFALAISLMIAIVSTLPPALLALRLPIATAVRRRGD
jgi:ABC-type antimicrobial peptide transport system permease subunit